MNDLVAILRRGMVSLAVCGGMAAPGSVLAVEPLAGSEIVERIAGNTIVGHTADGEYFLEYYAEDEEVRADGHTGIWFVNGDEFCLSFGRGVACHEVTIGAQNFVVLSRAGELRRTGILIEGNPNEL